MGKDSTAPPKPFLDSKTYWLKGRTLNAIWKAIRENKPLPGLNVSLSQRHDGVEINAAAGAGADDTPWSYSFDSEGVIVTGGTVQGHVVSGDVFAVSPSGNTYIFIHVTEDLTVSNGFVNSFDFVSAVMDSGTVVPDDDMGGGEYYIPLLKFVDGAFSERYESTSLGFRVIDDGTITGKGRGEYWIA